MNIPTDAGNEVYLPAICGADALVITDTPLLFPTKDECGFQEELGLPVDADLLSVDEEASKRLAFDCVLKLPIIGWRGIAGAIDSGLVPIFPALSAGLAQDLVGLTKLPVLAFQSLHLLGHIAR